MNKAPYVLVVAGGSGTRLWPLSRRMRPKFLSDFGSGRSLLADTLIRARAVTDANRITIITGEHHVEQVRTIARHQGISSVLVEPQPRGTAAAITAAMFYIGQQDASAVVVTLPADHLVSGREAWAGSINTAVNAAQSTDLVCLGVPAASADTGLGYIHAPSTGAPDAARTALAFTEKPDATLAESYVRAGDYFWNTAIMAWRCDRFDSQLRDHAPDVHEAVEASISSTTGQFHAEAWARVPNVAIEYALLQPATAQGAVAMVPAPFKWTDIGSWSAVADHAAASADMRDRTHQLETRDCFVLASPGTRQYALLGVEELIVVDCGDVVLVANRSHAQRVKHLVAELDQRGWGELL